VGLSRQDVSKLASANVVTNCYAPRPALLNLGTPHPQTRRHKNPARGRVDRKEGIVSGGHIHPRLSTEHSVNANEIRSWIVRLAPSFARIIRSGHLLEEHSPPRLDPRPHLLALSRTDPQHAHLARFLVRRARYLELFTMSNDRHPAQCLPKLLSTKVSSYRISAVASLRS
jgi:hypothetical protein